MVRFEYDREVNALYIYLRDIPDGAVARNIELQEGVYLDADEDGRTFGLEFLDFENFREWLDQHGGRVEIPERVNGQSNETPVLWSATISYDKLNVEELSSKLDSLSTEELQRVRDYESRILEQIDRKLSRSAAG